MLAAAHWRQALQVFQDGEQHYAWQLRETELGPYLALDGVPQPHRSAGGKCTSEAILDYHICYSSSYQVPVMHLRAMRADGAPLSHDAVQRLFPSWPQHSEQLLGFITQQEHPLLPGPCWYALHPCNTAVALALAMGLEAGATAALAPAQLDTSAAAGGTGAGDEHLAPAEAEAGAEAGAAQVGGTALVRGRSRSPTRRRSAAREGGTDGMRSGSPAAQVFPGQEGEERQGQGPSERAAVADEREVLPDLDQLLGGQGAVGEREAGGGLVVGPAGVCWSDGGVPLCPGGPQSLLRYMRAWMSLVGPHVGLTAGRVRLA